MDLYMDPTLLPYTLPLYALLLCGSCLQAMNLLMQLRKCCNHPFMFPDAEPEFDGESTGEDIVEASGKMKAGPRPPHAPAPRPRPTTPPHASRPTPRRTCTRRGGVRRDEGGFQATTRPRPTR